MIQGKIRTQIIKAMTLCWGHVTSVLFLGRIPWASMFAWLLPAMTECSSSETGAHLHTGLWRSLSLEDATSSSHPITCYPSDFCSFCISLTNYITYLLVYFVMFPPNIIHTVWEEGLYFFNAASPATRIGLAHDWHSVQVYWLTEWMGTEWMNMTGSWRKNHFSASKNLWNNFMYSVSSD